MPYEIEWWRYTCQHDNDIWMRGNCPDCQKEHDEFEAKMEKDRQHVDGLLRRMRNGGYKSLRDMLNSDCRNGAMENFKTYTNAD